jgi:hypothetical protein
MRNQRSRSLPRKTTQDGRTQQTVPGQIARRRRPRYSDRRPAGGKKVGEEVPTLALYPTGGINHEPSLRMKERAGYFDSAKWRHQMLLYGKPAPIPIDFSALL